MRYYLYASAGLLVAATAVSALIDNWTVLTGVAIAVVMVVLGAWFDDKGAEYDAETERAREALIGPKPSQTTYYYDDDSSQPDEGTPARPVDS